MHFILQHVFHVENLRELVLWGGYAVMAAIVFAETGLLVGFFLPGDSLLVTAGLIASQGQLDILTLNLLLGLAAIAGDTVGYWIGAATGPRIFTREESLLFKRRHLLATQAFYERHGGKTIILARFMPLARTFAPVVAGVGRMSYRRFLAFNVFGGAGWVASMTLAGYFLGRVIPGIDKHIEPVIAVVVFLSILPGIVAFLRARLAARRQPATS